MFKFKKLRFYLISALLILAGLVLLFNKILAAGLVSIGIAVLVFLLWELFLNKQHS